LSHPSAPRGRAFRSRQAPCVPTEPRFVDHRTSGPRFDGSAGRDSRGSAVPVGDLARLINEIAQNTTSAHEAAMTMAVPRDRVRRDSNMPRMVASAPARVYRSKHPTALPTPCKPGYPLAGRLRARRSVAQPENALVASAGKPQASLAAAVTQLDCQCQCRPPGFRAHRIISVDRDRVPRRDSLTVAQRDSR
jgi:hypothetical protein